MKTIVDTGYELVEIVNGVLNCSNSLRNWETIGDWMENEIDNDDFKALIRVENGNIYIELPDETPVATLGSLLEAFEYQ
jgi:hypothetical protein